MHLDIANLQTRFSQPTVLPPTEAACSDGYDVGCAYIWAAYNHAGEPHGYASRDTLAAALRFTTEVPIHIGLTIADLVIEDNDAGRFAQAWEWLSLVHDVTERRAPYVAHLA